MVVKSGWNLSFYISVQLTWIALGELKKMRLYIKPISCFLIAFIMGMFFFVFKIPPIRNDSAGYHDVGMEISKRGLSAIIDEAQAREPGYHIFLGVCFKIFGPKNNIVRFIQIILSAFTSLLIYSIAKRYYGENTGFISGLLYSFCPTFAYYPTFFLSESLAVFLFVVSYRLIIKATDTGNFLFAGLSGVCLAAASLTKFVFLFFGFFSVFFMFFMQRGVKWGKRQIGIIAIIGLLPIVSVFAWSNYNVHKTDPSIQQDRRLGRTLIFSISELGLSSREQSARFVSLISRNLAEKLFPEIDFKKLWPHPEVHKQLLKEANKKYAAEKSGDVRYLLFAFDLYKESPWRYLFSRISTLMRLNSFQYPSRLNETHRWKDFYNRGNNKSVVVIFLDIFLKLLSNPFFWALGGSIVMIREKLSLSPVILPVLYINMIYCFLDGIPRFCLPALPFYLIAAAVLFVWLLKKVENRLEFRDEIRRALVGKPL